MEALIALMKQAGLSPVEQKKPKTITPLMRFLGKKQKPETEVYGRNSPSVLLEQDIIRRRTQNRQNTRVTGGMAGISATLQHASLRGRL
jgi:hypothetical protein